MPTFLLITAIGLPLFALAVLALIWLIRSGQFDDLDTPALRMLADDEPVAPPSPTIAPGPRNTETVP